MVSTPFVSVSCLYFFFPPPSQVDRNTLESIKLEPNTTELWLAKYLTQAAKQNYLTRNAGGRHPFLSYLDSLPSHFSPDAKCNPQRNHVFVLQQQPLVQDFLSAFLPNSIRSRNWTACLRAAMEFVQARFVDHTMNGLREACLQELRSAVENCEGFLVFDKDTSVIADDVQVDPTRRYSFPCV